MGDVSTFRLPNGLRVIVVSNCLESATICLRGLAGSNYESDNEVGVAHMLEHISFCGSQKYPNDELKHLVTKVGGKITGTTSRDDVAFFVKVLKNNVEIGLEFLSELFYNLNFDANSLDRLKKIIKCEIDQNREDVRKHIGRIAYKILYPNQRFSKYNTGDVSDVDNITIEKLVNFKKRLYSPNNFVLTICGNVKTSNIKSLTKLYFQKQVDIQATPITILTHKQNKDFATQFEKRANSKLCHLKIDYHGYPSSSLAHYNAIIGAAVLKEMLLYNLGKYTQTAPYILDIASFSSFSYGLLGLYTEIPDISLKEFLNIFFYTLNFLSEQKVNAYELEQIKLRIINDFIFSLEKTSLRADHYSELFLYQSTVFSHINEIDILRNTSPESLFDIFRYLSTQMPKITIIGNATVDIKNIYNRALVTT